MSITENSEVSRIVSTLIDKQGEDLVVIDLSSKSYLADFFVLATANSDVHKDTLVEYTKDLLEEMGMTYRVEGESTSNWVLIDAGIIVVHIFSRQGRDFYRLENLWSSCPIHHFSDPV
ncbi:iojap-like protein [Thermovirga lienii DSM 17291]|jgi:ribosome-associated protein|uniref:Ribosomal silencing factor RsfS n=1 Tax=Thermovirga lienii (strain ATCC BAA-1197 / DSM 17291 / Cas60314) TaxID=580340 RepID=G7VA32_THELD|nr:ribosome silencing factor [Thermovirga lienii]MDN5318873.1 ribosome-associated protein [Thermovirga sp.]AER66732.1 iojap-like protein [Thermovirga lienii DSM 17291]KUK43112.1 MAG: Ribosomal silencing factor RsfS [Thermovirga lienii]MDN5368466.1 ribosome-associated protein [Thermovirga sp.]HCD70981.1 ribosome silencing factor [Thermovirga lienii]